MERIAWAREHMPLLAALAPEMARERPLEGATLGMCLHIEPKTAVLCSLLRAAGARVALTGSPGTTQDDVAAALAGEGILVYGRRDDDAARHRDNVARVLDHGPTLLLDNGADLVAGLLERGRGGGVLGGTEETTTGANRLREDLSGAVGFPVIVINDSPLKSIVENQHGVGQTVVDGFLRVTNLMLPGRRCVVIGFGWCGRGVARYLKNFGARVTVVERDAVRALEAAMEGFEVRELDETLASGQLFVTVTGRPGVLRREHFETMRDGAILANAGHFSWEIDVAGLRADARETARVDAAIERFRLPSGKRLYLLARGEMLNLAGGGGNPVEVMDLGLSLQALSLARVATGGAGLSPGPQPVPDDINREVARRMLDAMRA
jgi:adenosylhomocysteinase